MVEGFLRKRAGVTSPAHGGESLTALRAEYSDRVGEVEDLRADYFGVLALLHDTDPTRESSQPLWLDPSDFDTIELVVGGYTCLEN